MIFQVSDPEVSSVVVIEASSISLRFVSCSCTPSIFDLFAKCFGKVMLLTAKISEAGKQAAVFDSVVGTAER